jgi:hypothetical protein
MSLLRRFERSPCLPTDPAIKEYPNSAQIVRALFCLGKSWRFRLQKKIGEAYASMPAKCPGFEENI